MLAKPVEALRICVEVRQDARFLVGGPHEVEDVANACALQVQRVAHKRHRQLAERFERLTAVYYCLVESVAPGNVEPKALAHAVEEVGQLDVVARPDDVCAAGKEALARLSDEDEVERTVARCRCALDGNLRQVGCAGDVRHARGELHPRHKQRRIAAGKFMRRRDDAVFEADACDFLA